MKKKTLGVLAGLMAVLLAVAGSVKLYDYLNPKEDETIDKIFDSSLNGRLYVFEFLNDENYSFKSNLLSFGKKFITNGSFSIFYKDGDSIDYLDYNAVLTYNPNISNLIEANTLDGPPSFQTKLETGFVSLDMSNVNLENYSRLDVILSIRELRIDDLFI